MVKHKTKKKIQKKPEKLNREKMYANGSLLSDYEVDLVARGMNNPSFFFTVYYHYLKERREKDARDDFSQILKTAKSLEKIFGQVVQKLDTSKPAAKKFKMKLEQIPNDAETETIIQTSISLSSYKHGLEMYSNESFSLVMLTAEELIRQAYQKDKLNDLLEAIDRCRKIILPHGFSYMYWEHTRLPMMNDTDLCDVDDCSCLASILAQCAPDVFYQSVYYNAYPDEADDYRRAETDAIRKKKDLIWKEISPFISSSFKRKAVKVSSEAMGIIYAQLLTHLERTVQKVFPKKNTPAPALLNLRIRQQIEQNNRLDQNLYPSCPVGPHLNNLPLTRNSFIPPCPSPADMTINMDVAREEITNAFNAHFYEYCETCKRGERLDNGLLKILDNAGLTAAGLYLSILDNPDWLYLYPAIATMLLLSSNGAHAYQKLGAVATQECMEGTNQKLIDHAEQVKPIVEPVVDMFLNQKGIVSSNGSKWSLTNEQVLAMFGLHLLSPDDDFDEKEEILQKVTPWLADIDPASEALMGAATAVYMLTQGKLISMSQRTVDDRSEFIKRAEQAEEVARNAARKAEDLNRAINAKEDEITMLRAQNEALERKLQAREEELRETRKQKNFLHDNVDELLETIDAFTNAGDEEEVGEESFPASLNGKKVLSFGGFSSFLTPLQEMLPELTIYQDRRPDAITIKNVDAVFIQSNRMGHADFYYLMDICRDNDIPVEVYRFPGAKSCAKQILKFIQNNL